MQANFVQACALVLALTGCATVPALHGAPEDIANQIGGNAVAYNQAYGRAISDQVLLNVLRARDRLPLYHLSMSGISDASELALSGGVTISEFSAGDGNGGVGSITGSRTLTTKPSYALNPFAHDNDHPGGTPFEPIQPEFFQHYWDAEWPREVLILIMADSLATGTGRRAVSRGNDPHTFRGECTPPAEGRVQGGGCAFLDWVTDIVRDRNARFAGNCTTPRVREGQPAQRRRCSPTITTTTREYRVELRALDDMIYYVGGVLRTPPGADLAVTSPIRVRPAGLYTDDTLPDRGFTPWTAPLFRIRQSERRRNDEYAAQVTYRGERYVAGPAINANCLVGDNTCLVPHEGDRTALVLSLLSQLVVLTQDNGAQTAPERVLAR
jgi:hypothetical protein